MKSIYRKVFLGLSAMMLVCCTTAEKQETSDKEKAAALVNESRHQVEAGNLGQAKLLLDSLEHTYAMCVDARRAGDALMDSIEYIEAARTYHFADSALQTLLPQVEPLMKSFTYEKNEKYEDKGKLVHKLLTTNKNAERCYLQAYMFEDDAILVKSYYFGSVSLKQNEIELSSGENFVRKGGRSHDFEAGGYHSMLTVEGEDAKELLGFCMMCQQERIRVNLLGADGKGNEKNYVYYLQDNEKKALAETYQLSLLMSEIHRLEEMARLSSKQIGLYENRYRKQ